MNKQSTIARPSCHLLSNQNEQILLQRKRGSVRRSDLWIWSTRVPVENSSIVNCAVLTCHYMSTTRWSLSQLPLGERQGRRWTGCQSVRRPTSTTNHASFKLVETIFLFLYVFLDHVRKLEYAEITHKLKRNTCKPHAERPQPGFKLGGWPPHHRAS